MMHVVCPYCQNQIAVADNWSGVMVCTRCSRQVAVQNPGAPRPAPPKAPPVKPAAAGIVQPLTAAPSKHSYTRGRRKKNNELLVISALALVGILVVGTLFAIFVIAPNLQDEPAIASSNTYTYDEANVDPASEQSDASSPQEAVEKRSSDETADSASQEDTGDATTKADAGSADDMPPEETKHTQGAPLTSPDQTAVEQAPVEEVPVDKTPAEGAAEPVAEPAADEPAEQIVGTPVSAKDAERVITNLIRGWHGGSSYGSAVTQADHVAKFDMPEWKDFSYELDRYKIDPDNDFESETEQRFWLLLEFRNQGTEQVRRLMALRVDQNGRWVIAPVPGQPGSKPPRQLSINPNPIVLPEK